MFYKIFTKENEQKNFLKFVTIRSKKDIVKANQNIEKENKNRVSFSR